ncbi:2-oxo-4-hydroxy-4-carboxy-5-ureidoimidazoline decarboxylase [Sodalis sp. dw_96]|uniref:2-oxo-4-hydroxy-4-carboxy-5-ureidoimidazoline decarboxylase n=1 Tax=Sodalis sp. dw_96 TaxID=2719794 RepID=UPI001BD6300F|nr:2-oxo-4-hydroxy-4-carboxy-5-ureidoimidazoline decarboxylase [Sodalis sp. dw_96]
MTFDEFNHADAALLKPLLLVCAAVGSWADDIIAARPFSGLDELLAFADDAARRWGAEQVDEALLEHPRIGESREHNDAAAEHSRREQPVLTDGDERLKIALREGNRQYEAKFGRIFLIRAAGRSGEEILACLRHRLQNGVGQEQSETAKQLREIALLRLRQGLS